MTFKQPVLLLRSEIMVILRYSKRGVKKQGLARHHAGPDQKFPYKKETIKRRQRMATAAMFFQRCIAQALSCGDEPNHSLCTSK